MAAGDLVPLKRIGRSFTLRSSSPLSGVRGMFKGYIRVTTKRGNHTIGQTIGRGCGRPMLTAEAALELAEAEVRRVIAL